MEDRIYHGYAFGGPLSGQIITSETPEFRAYKYPEIPEIEINKMPGLVKAEIQIVTYYFNSHNQWVCNEN